MSVLNNNISNISIRNASIKYQGILYFDHLNIDIPADKITCLLGPSGTGKTTLLQMIAGFISKKNTKLEMIQGEISYDENKLLSSQIAYLAQNDALLPWLHAMDNALLGYHLRGDINNKIKEHANFLFKKMKLDGAQKKFPKQLSGGMRQRIALIRTFLEDKSIVLMDEPFSSLDAITRFQLQTLSVELLKNKTVFLVTHDPFEALRMAHQIIILAGRPARLYKPVELTTDPPRSLDDPNVLETQSILFRALTEAAEMQS